MKIIKSCFVFCVVAIFGYLSNNPALSSAAADKASTKSQTPQTRVVLVKDGKPNASIVVAAKAAVAAQIAAGELQYHIKLITGATLPIVDDTVAVKGTRILIGESSATRALHLKSSDFPDQQYLVHLRPDTITLIGKDKPFDGRVIDYYGEQLPVDPLDFEEMASLWATYDFLERFCGVRWYLPTDLGITFKARKTLEVKGGDIRRAPAWKYRNMQVDIRFPDDLIGDTISPGQENMRPLGGSSSKAERLWALRQRIGGVPFVANHSFYGYYARFHEQHPDWFAQGYGPIDSNSQLCYSNPEVIEQVVQDARDYFDGKGLKPKAFARGDYFALVPMDSARWCQCPRCQALLNNNPKTNNTVPAGWNNSIASNYIWGFVNKVAAEVRRTHPTKKLAAIAYWQYGFPPGAIEMQPNVAVELTVHSRSNSSLTLQQSDSLALQQWKSKLKGQDFFVWQYLCFPSQGAAQQGFRPFPGFSAHAIARHMKQYQAAGVRGFFYEASYLRPDNAFRSPLFDQLDSYVIHKLADDAGLNGDSIINEFFKRYYGAAGRPMQQFYEEVERAYADPKNHPLGIALQEVHWKYLGTPSRMAKLETFMQQARAAAKTGPEKERVALFDRGIWQRMVSGRQMFVEREASAKLPAPVTAPRIAAANGDLEKADWGSAVSLGLWKTLQGDVTDRKVDARIMHDGSYLYLQFEENGIDASNLLNDDAVWTGDDWEVFFADSRDWPYHHVGLSPLGNSITLVQPAEALWQSGAKLASDISQPDRWRVRIALPLKNLTVKGVQPGDHFFMNAVRITKLKSILAWVPTLSGIHRPERFGEIVLAK